jgi:hypothetical protein
LRAVLKREKDLKSLFGLLCCTLYENPDLDEDGVEKILGLIHFKVPDGAEQDRKLFEMCLMLENFRNGCKDAKKFDKK